MSLWTMSQDGVLAPDAESSDASPAGRRRMGRFSARPKRGCRLWKKEFSAATGRYHRPKKLFCAPAGASSACGKLLAHGCQNTNFRTRPSSSAPPPEWQPLWVLESRLPPPRRRSVRCLEGPCPRPASIERRPQIAAGGGGVHPWRAPRLPAERLENGRFGCLSQDARHQTPNGWPDSDPMGREAAHGNHPACKAMAGFRHSLACRAFFFCSRSASFPS